MSWEPITREALQQEIDRGVREMSERHNRLWRMIAVEPAKWSLPPWGDLGDGFWVVGLLGQTVVWFNDIECGFNRSRYTRIGTIDEYWCNQDELHWTVNHLLDECDHGRGHSQRLGPPEEIV